MGQVRYAGITSRSLSAGRGAGVIMRFVYCTPYLSFMGAKGFKRRGLEGFALAVFGPAIVTCWPARALRIALDGKNRNRGGGCKTLSFCTGRGWKARLVLRSLLVTGLSNGSGYFCINRDASSGPTGQRRQNYPPGLCRRWSTPDEVYFSKRIGSVIWPTAAAIAGRVRTES